ncbi:aldo/keto reductase [Paenibacillus hunanensis]|uniref:aldo/keto reductase n=1 Tax=Paenibacillus hunanensis TaxID=539262 RepID=UPI00202659B3|nr:aldo/keto reductase [Paenibacillus hunanensis]MCL9660926.1 aldo/keto reductase [Paenibacillus hunanensis]
MKYRKLGKTGLDVPVLSFGASSLGGVFRSTDDGESVRTVHTAIDAGMNYIDVSPYYGLTRAETVLGQALRSVPRDRYLLSSKAGRYGEREFDFSSERILRSVDESLERLSTDYLDMLFLHDVEFGDPQQIVEESVPTLELLKQQGKIRFGGISGLPLSMFELLLPQMEVDIILSYCHYALNDTSLLSLLPLLESQHIGLVSASPLSMGLLSTRPVADWHPAGDELKHVCYEAALYCQQQGVEIAQLAMQFAVQQESIPTTLVSTANPDNVLRNVRWIEEPIQTEVLEEVLRILKPVHNQTWASGLELYNRPVTNGGEA